MRLLAFWWIRQSLTLARWHGRQHGRIIDRCERSLIRMGVAITKAKRLLGEAP